MLKKVAFALVAGSLVLAAQVASADDTQSRTGEMHQGVSVRPLDESSKEARARYDAVAQSAAPQNEHLMLSDSAKKYWYLPAPYDKDTGWSLSD